MIPIVDARSGQVLKVGDRVPHENSIILDVRVGLTTAQVLIQGDVFGEGRNGSTWLPAPVKWFPRLTYGPGFPVGGLRVVMLPT